MKKKWMQFYPSDWRSDPPLRTCSIAARGLWVEMLCIMHEADPRGFLLINGKPISKANLASLTGCADVGDLLDELETAGVFSFDKNGVIYSRRMVRDDEKIANARESGKRGGNPSLMGRVNPTVKGQVKGGDNGQVKGGDNYTLSGDGLRVGINYIPESIKEDEDVVSLRSTPSSSTGRESDDSLPRPIGEKKSAGSSKGKTASLNAEFDQWYSNYPHKVGKGQAVKAFAKARQSASLQELIDGVEAYKRSKPADRAWRNPATWLNGLGWLDKPAEVNGKPMAASPEDLVELKSGRQVARKIVFGRCVEYFAKKRDGIAVSWSQIPAWGDEFPPDDPRTIYPPSIIEAARKEVWQ